MFFRTFALAAVLAAILTVSTSIASAQDFEKGLTFANNGDFTAAIKEWQPLAEQGDARAQFKLGFMYANGNGVLKDATEAVRWFRLAAEQGIAQAQANLGFMYGKDKPDFFLWPFDAEGAGPQQGLEFLRFGAEKLRNLGWQVEIGKDWPCQMYEGAHRIFAGVKEGEDGVPKTRDAA